MHGTFYAPQSAKEALDIKISDKKAFFLSGGTVLNTWREGRKKPISLISLAHAGLNEIKIENGKLNIGAFVTMTQMQESNLLLSNPLFNVFALNFKIISKNIRNMATLGGIIGSNFSRSDTLPLLCTLDAKVRFLTEKGESIVPIIDYLLLPPTSEAKLILSVEIPVNPTLKLSTARFARSSNDLPVVITACSYENNCAKFKNLKIYAGGVSDKVLRLLPLEMALEGKDIEPKIVAQTIKETIKDMKNPPSDLRGSGDFKKTMLLSLLEDTLLNKERCGC